MWQTAGRPAWGNTHFYDLSYSRRPVTGRSTESSKTHNYPPHEGPWGHRPGALRNGVWYNQRSFVLTLCGRKTVIKQLRCTWACSGRVHSWSFLWFNKNVFAFTYYNCTRKLKYLARHRLKKENERLTNLRSKVSISNLNNIKPILFKNKHKAFVWAVSHPRFFAIEKWTAALWGGNVNIKGWRGPALHSWDMGHPYRHTCFDDTHENTKEKKQKTKKTPYKTEIYSKKNKLLEIYYCVCF